jgi:hypothetical protein
MLEITEKYTCDLTGVVHCKVVNEIGREFTLLENEIIEIKKQGFVVKDKTKQQRNEN